jgi:hypothetical protein
MKIGSARVKNWRIKNPDKHKIIQKNYRINHKDYYRNWQFVNKYGITISQRNKMEEIQNGLCAICDNPPSNRGLVIDHNRITGKVRGLLCYNCNKALGLFKENAKALKKAAEYLTRTHEKDKVPSV